MRHREWERTSAVAASEWLREKTKKKKRGGKIDTGKKKKKNRE